MAICEKGGAVPLQPIEDSMRLPLLSALFLLLACAQPGEAQPTTQPTATDWEIGPIIRSKNYSVGMPLHPTPSRRGWQFDFPQPSERAGHVHYVTFRHGPLTGKRSISMRYRIDAAPGVRFVARETPQMPATISFVIQQRGDNWSGRGRYESYRWYAPAQSVREIAPGVYEMTARLDAEWTSVMGKSAASDPRGFREAIDNADRIGFVLGTHHARGHGVYATGPARLTLLGFEVN